MLKMKEDLLQFIWQRRLLKPAQLYTLSGEELNIISVGELNRDAGPDFSNARIKVGGLELAGNIEIHVRSSDWLKHGHQRDRSYDTLILHVVYEQDVVLDQNKDNGVKVLELKKWIDPSVLQKYGQLIGSRQQLPCASMLKDVSDFKLISWMERMAIERLETKTKRVQDLFDAYRGDYVAVFYTLLLRNFGFQVNALPFELLSRQLPYSLLLKHADNLLQLEALLLGSAGFLEEQFENPYVRQLQNEFEHLKLKYSLKPLKKEVFKFSRLRPANFPDRRLAQFAKLIHDCSGILNKTVNVRTYREWMDLLSVRQDGFWKNHFRLTGEESAIEKNFGTASAENILVNSVAPFFFFYGKKNSRPDMVNAAIALLSKCSAEENAKTKLFSVKKSVLRSASDSQGVINLFDNYCSKRNCLNCAIANTLLRSA